MHSFSLPPLPAAAGLLAAGSSLLGTASAATLTLRDAVLNIDNTTDTTTGSPDAEHNPSSFSRQEQLLMVAALTGGGVLAAIAKCMINHYCCRPVMVR